MNKAIVALIAFILNGCAIKPAQDMFAKPDTPIEKIQGDWNACVYDAKVATASSPTDSNPFSIAIRENQLVNLCMQQKGYSNK